MQVILYVILHAEVIIDLRYRDKLIVSSVTTVAIVEATNNAINATL